MYTLLLVVQVLIAIGLIVLVLLQHGKGADAGAAFGSGASATVFGSRGAGSFLTRSTAVLATLFFANSLLLSTPLILDGTSAPVSVTERVAPMAPAESEPAPVESAPADLPDAPPAGEAPASGAKDLP